MTVSPGEETLAVACKNNNIGLVNIKSIGLNENLSNEIKFDLVCRGFHSGSINAIDVAIQRPIIVTCSREDSTIRLWNYYTHSCELAREYYVLEDMAIREAAKPLISVAIHPSGYYMAASFIDKIRFFHILHDELRHYKNIEIKNCQRMKFSTGGHLFFAVANKTIQIFNSYTLMRLTSVGTYPLGVSDIVIGEKDQSFAVVAPDGQIGRYKTLPKFEIIKEGVDK